MILRPLSMDEFDQEWANRLEMDPSVQPIMPTRDALRVRFERSGIMQSGALDLAIEVAGRTIGGIQTYVPPDRTLPSGAFEIGIVIDEPSMRGKGYGTEAVSLLLDGCSRMRTPPEYTCPRLPTTWPCAGSRSGSGSKQTARSDTRGTSSSSTSSPASAGWVAGQADRSSALTASVILDRHDARGRIDKEAAGSSTSETRLLLLGVLLART